MDIGLWEGRIEAGLDFYLKETTDLLSEIDISALSGVNRVTSNIGALQNKGFDLSLTTHNLTGKLKWVTSLNLAYNVNEVTDLGGRDFIAGQIFGLSAVAVGHPVGVRYAVPWAGIAAEDMMLTVTEPNSGNPIEIQVKGGDELFINQFGEVTNIYDPNDQTFLGDQTNMHRPTWLANNRNYATDRIIYDADFARLKDVMIGYTFPKTLIQKWKISSMRVFARGTNLATLSDYPGWDPEYNRDQAGNTNQGKSWLPSPQARSVSFGLNVTF